MSVKQERKKLSYRYPRDCGEKTLFKKGVPGKSIATLHFECYHWEDFRSGGHLSLVDPDSSSSSSSSDNENYVCELALELYDEEGWFVYWADMVCDQAQTHLLGRFASFEGAEIYARILNGDSMFKDEERVHVSVHCDRTDEEEDDDFATPESDNGESCGTYLILVNAYGCCHAHSLNPSDDWDQVGRTALDIKPSAERPARKKKKVNSGP